MNGGRLRTADYSEEARKRLGKAVELARKSIGFKFRPAFARFAGISKRSLDAIENGEPGVGETNLDAVSDAIPHWTEETPKIILEGGPIPPNPTKPPPPIRETPLQPPAHEWSAEARQKMISWSAKEALDFIETERVMRGEAAALRAMHEIVRVREEAGAIPLDVEQ